MAEEHDGAEARLLRPIDLLWLGLGLFAVLVLALLGRPVLELAWDFLVVVLLVVWFAHVRRSTLPMWPIIVIAPVLVLLPGVLFGWGDEPTTAQDLLELGGPLVLVAGLVAAVEVLAGREDRRERAREAGVLDDEESEEDARRNLRWMAVAAVFAGLLGMVLLVSAVRDGGWFPVLLFGLAPVVLPDLWRRFRNPRPGAA